MNINGAVSAYNGTAWWGWCADCGVPFGNHNISCPQMASYKVNAAAANPIALALTTSVNAAAARSVQMFMFTSGGAR